MEDISTLQEQNTKLNARLEKAKEVFRSMKEEMESKDAEISKLKIEIDTLTLKLESKSSSSEEIHILNEKNNELTEIVENLTTELDEINHELEEKTKAYDELLAEAKAYRNSVIEREDNIQKAMNVLSDSINKTKGDLEQAQTVASQPKNYPGMHNFLNI